jgi:hypothetical protein
VVKPENYVTTYGTVKTAEQEAGFRRRAPPRGRWAFAAAVFRAWDLNELSSATI